MLTEGQIAENAFSLIETNFYESFFFRPGGLIGVEVNSILVIGLLFGLILILALYFDRNNGYTPGYHSRANGSYTAAVILVLVPYFIFRPSTEQLEKTEINLANKLNKQIALVESLEIDNETNPFEKAKAIEKAVDSSGKIYYVLYEKEKEDSHDFDFQEKPKKHFYVNEHNYQSEYISIIKKLEKDFRNSSEKDIEIALYLENLFNEGNVFVKPNYKKSSYFEHQIKTLKSNELSKTPKVKSVQPVSI